MANIIHCCATPDGPRFRVWSTVVDCYVTDPLTREEMRERLVDDEVRAARRFAEERLARAEERGTSAHDDVRDTSGWDVERCDGCGGFHHEWDPSGRPADYGPKMEDVDRVAVCAAIARGDVSLMGCRRCGLVRSDRTHGPACEART